MKLRITVHGVAYDVEVEVLDAGEGFHGSLPSPLPQIRPKAVHANEAADVAPPPNKPLKHRPDTTSTTAAGGSITSPIAGNVLEIKAKSGDSVQKNQVLLVIEAMKMETSIAAPTSGTIKSVDVAVGDAVREGQTLVQFE